MEEERVDEVQVELILQALDDAEQHGFEKEDAKRLLEVLNQTTERRQ